MVHLIQNSISRFDRLRRPLKYEIEVVAVILGLLILIVPIAGVYNAREGEQKAGSFIRNYGEISDSFFDKFDGIGIFGSVPFVDPPNYNYRLNLKFIPYGVYRNSQQKNAISVPMQIIINGRKLEVVGEGEVIPAQDQTFTFTSGI